jgi:hypothetical protein
MTEKNPSEVLANAVHDFWAAVSEGDNAGHVSGWVLSFETVRIQADPKYDALVSAPRYLIGEGTSIASAMGLIHSTRVHLDAAVARSAFDYDDDEDDEDDDEE